MYTNLILNVKIVSKEKEKPTKEKESCLRIDEQLLYLIQHSSDFIRLVK
jgi:hypothetical protein